MSEKPKRTRVGWDWIKPASIVIAMITIPAVYFGAYFALGRLDSGEAYMIGRPVTGRYVYHDRLFDFDPWMFKPAAKLECWLRGKRSQVVIKDGGDERDKPGYIYGGPF